MKGWGTVPGSRRLETWQVQVTHDPWLGPKPGGRVSCKAITETAGTISEPTVDPANPPHPDFGKHTVTGEKKYLLEKTYWNLYAEGKCLHTTLKWFRRKYKHVCIQSTQITMVGLTMAHGVLYAVQPNIHSLSVITSKTDDFQNWKNPNKMQQKSAWTAIHPAAEEPGF